MPFCPECGKPVAAKAKFCRNCGASQIEESPDMVTPAAMAAVPEPAGNLCRSCNGPLAPGEKFCGSCGAKTLDESSPIPADVPTAVPPPAPVPVVASPPPVNACRSCGSPYEPGTKFCGICGAATGGAPIVAQPAPSSAVPAPAAPVSVRLCRACGNPIKPGDKYCSKCLVLVKDDVPVSPPPATFSAPVPAPAPVAAPPQAGPGSYACASCGNPLSGTEKFCGICGSPAVAARPAAPAPAPAVPSGKFCGSCGTPVSDTTKFCGGCGAPVGASFLAGNVTVPPASGGEQVIGVIGNARKMKMFGVSWDTYNIIVTDRRMILAQLTQEKLNAAIAEANAKAKAEGKGFFGIAADQMKVSSQYALRYETMSPDAALAETPGNRAIENTRITGVKMKLKQADEDSADPSEFRMIIDSQDGSFEFMIAEDDRFINTLKAAYGEKVSMPLGYFRARSIEIKLF